MESKGATILDDMASIPHQESNTSSPNSSEDVDSRHATPATKFSAFSPDDTRDVTSSIGRRIIRGPAFELKITTASSNSTPQQGNTKTHQDPFFISSPFCSTAPSTRSSADASKLSPVAAAFTPSTDIDSPMRADNCYDSRQVSSTTTNQTIDTPSENKDSTATKFLPGAAATSAASCASVVDFGAFSSEENTSRYLMIQLGKQTSLNLVKKYIDRHIYPSLVATVVSELSSHGIIYVQFLDIRETDKAFATIRHGEAHLAVQHITPIEFATKHQSPTLGQTSMTMHESQVLVKARYHGKAQSFDVALLSHTVKEVLDHCGEIMAFRVERVEEGLASFRVEYFDTQSVEHALSYVEGRKLGTCTLTICRYEPGVSSPPRTSRQKPGPIIIGQEDVALEQSFNRMHIHDFHGTDSHDLRATGQTSPRDVKIFSRQNTPSSLVTTSQTFRIGTPEYPAPWSPSSGSYGGYGVPSPIWSSCGPGAIGQERGSSSPAQHRHMIAHDQVRSSTKYGGRHQHDFAAVHHNVVDVDRILAGLDVRTTIMLRNIPNKVDQAMLKDIVDESSLGKYDFMYLRIDFANNCNVGYAFINFEDPLWIVDFVSARAGQRWNRFNSDKVAEVSYATIQGRDCLVQKFRNSSVMYEDTKFRPKLYHTGTGPLVGTEERFPAPDNLSKMRRSVENAGHIGLFAPRAGQNYRDEQRRRRSQYDRGTRMAEMETDNLNPTHHISRGQLHNFQGGSFGNYNAQHFSGLSQFY